MKPCFRNRKRIAWLAINTLDGPQAAALREHLAKCEGCRRYWIEMSDITQTLQSAQAGPQVEPSPSFHRRLAERLHATEANRFHTDLLAWFRTFALSWRVALPVAAALAIMLYLSIAPPRHRNPAVATRPAQVASAPLNPSELAPTLANYQMLANKSLDALDELLTRQAEKGLPKVPVYALSSQEPGNGLF